MSKINDYNEKCLDEIFTEKDAQEEQRQKEYDLMKEALYDIYATCDRYATSLEIVRRKRD